MKSIGARFLFGRWGAKEPQELDAYKACCSRQSARGTTSSAIYGCRNHPLPNTCACCGCYHGAADYGGCASPHVAETKVTPADAPKLLEDQWAADVLDHIHDETPIGRTVAIKVIA